MLPPEYASGRPVLTTNEGAGPALTRKWVGRGHPASRRCCGWRPGARWIDLRGHPVPELEVAGRRVRFTGAGSGEPVLLLHAAFSSSAQWRSLSEAPLAPGGLRGLALFLQRSGGGAPPGP